jgi:hypothetical protein
MLTWALSNWQGIAFGLIIAIGPAYIAGRHDGASAERASAIAAAAEATAERLTEMGKNDAELRTMPKADLCRELLAASGLRDTSICDAGHGVSNGKSNPPGNR